MRVATILGTRPEIIRLSRVIAALDRHFEHVLVHYRPELRLRAEPACSSTSSTCAPPTTCSTRWATAWPRRSARIIERSDAVMERERPDALVLYGDTNTLPVGDPGQAAQDPRVPPGSRATAASTSACPRRSTGGSSITSRHQPAADGARAALPARRGDPSRDRVIKIGSPMQEMLTYYRPGIEASPVLQTARARAGRLLPGQRAPRGERRSAGAAAGSAGDAQRLADSFDLPVVLSTHPRTRARLDERGVSLPPQVHGAEAIPLQRLSCTSRCTPVRCCRTRARSARRPRSSTCRRSTYARPTSVRRRWRRLQSC